MHTFSLSYPVEHDGKSITSVELRRPKVKDIAAAEQARKDKGDFAVGVVLIARVSGLPESVVEEIDAEDFVPLAECLEDFMTRHKAPIGASMPPTSPTS